MQADNLYKNQLVLLIRQYTDTSAFFTACYLALHYVEGTNKHYQHPSGEVQLMGAAYFDVYFKVLMEECKKNGRRVFLTYSKRHTPPASLAILQRLRYLPLPTLEKELLPEEANALCTMSRLRLN